MRTKRDFSWVSRAIITVMLVAGVGLAGAHSSLAGCAGYCEARQARVLCHNAIKFIGLKGHQRDLEFEKCKRDPIAYLQLEELTDDTLNSFD